MGAIKGLAKVCLETAAYEEAFDLFVIAQQVSSDLSSSAFDVFEDSEFKVKLGVFFRESENRKRALQLFTASVSENPNFAEGQKCLRALQID